VRLVGGTVKFSKTTLEASYIWQKALVDIPAVSMPVAHSFTCGIVLCDKTAHFIVAFYCPPAQGAPV
jgi:hypothetical protein